MDSDDDYTSGENKKRKGDDEEEWTRKSKKTSRSPIKSHKQEDKIDRLLKMMENLTEETRRLTTEVQEIKEEQGRYRREMKDLRHEIEKVKNDNKNIQQEKEEIKKELKETKTRLQKLEKMNKANNIIMQGIPIDTEDAKILKQAIEDFMRKEMNIQVNIEEAVKIGRETCLIRMKNAQEKETVMQNKSKLRSLKEHRVFINSDLTKEELKIQKDIRERAKVERLKGKDVKVQYNKLIIDGKLWKWNKSMDELQEYEKQKPKN